MSAAVTTGTATTCQPRRDLGYELARYTVPAGERVLYGTRSNGVAIVLDAPAGTDGVVYLVERDVHQDGYGALRALLADYVGIALATGRIPMARRAADSSSGPAS